MSAVESDTPKPKLLMIVSFGAIALICQFEASLCGLTLGPVTTSNSAARLTVAVAVAVAVCGSAFICRTRNGTTTLQLPRAKLETDRGKSQVAHFGSVVGVVLDVYRGRRRTTPLQLRLPLTYLGPAEMPRRNVSLPLSGLD